jgi:hypothetical protein
MANNVWWESENSPFSGKKQLNTVYQFCFSFSEQKRQHLYRQQNIIPTATYNLCLQ